MFLHLSVIHSVHGGGVHPGGWGGVQGGFNERGGSVKGVP